MRSARLQRSVLLLAFVFFSIALSAQAYKPGVPLPMWKVSSGAHTAYLLGSIHVGDASLYPLPSVIENAFASASVLIVEVDIRNLDQMQMLQAMASQATYPPGDDLYKHISPKTRAKLDAFLATYGMPGVLFASFRPWMAGITISTLPMIKAGLNPNDGIDMYFLNKAGDKKVEQVESADEQLKLMASLPEAIADDWVSSAIDEAQTSKERWGKLQSYWISGNANKIDELVTDDQLNANADEKAFERRLREDRNPRMVDRLEKCLRSGDSCFMVVGTAHVVGKEGMVRQLQARGYRVEQAVVEAQPAH